MKMSDMFPSKYMAATDVEGEPDGEIQATMRNVTLETVKNKENEEEDRPVLNFREKSFKPMILNKTNANVIAAMFGDDTADWAGQRITIGTDIVSAFGKTAPALRVRMKGKAQARQSRALDTATAGQSAPGGPLADDEMETAITASQAEGIRTMMADLNLPLDTVTAMLKMMGISGGEIKNIPARAIAVVEDEMRKAAEANRAREARVQS